MHLAKPFVRIPLLVALLAILGLFSATATAAQEAPAPKPIDLPCVSNVSGQVLNATPVTEGDQPSQYAYYGEVGRAGRQKVEAGHDRLAVNGNGNGSRVAENGRAARHRRIRFGPRR